MEPYTALARQTIETFAKTGKEIPVPDNLPEDFYRSNKGAYVTIYEIKDGKKRLRGCVGTFEPVCRNIAEEIIRSAILASQRDNRFLPVTKDELAHLAYEVSLLEPPQQIYSSDQLDPKTYGVIVQAHDDRCGLLLPDIEGVNTPLEQIQIAARKGGIDPERDKFSLWRFAVTKYSEDKF